ncbi:MAG: hypothetical protein KAT04_01925, partial [Methylococcales bacterium]|nr:hypothetical protein [Methylococcales bacterium]
RIVLGDKGLDSGNVEYRARTDQESQDIALDEIIGFIKKQVQG